MARSVRIYKHAIVILSLIVGGIKKPDENTKRGWEKQEEKEIGRPSASSVCVCVAFGPKRFVYSLRELFFPLIYKQQRTLGRSARQMPHHRPAVSLMSGKQIKQPIPVIPTAIALEQALSAPGAGAPCPISKRRSFIRILLRLPPLMRKVNCKFNARNQ